jgi:LPXTG-site transpeptidase (sortase) family protein
MVLAIALPAMAERNTKQNLIVESKVIDHNITHAPKYVAAHPAEIVIPSVGIDLKIVDGDYNASTGWTVSPRYANFATITSEPNNRAGKTVIYGHDQPYIFAPTSGLKKGDKVYIHTNEQAVFVYQYTGDTVVSPTDTSVFNDTNKGAPQLSLITCSGTFYQVRRIMNLKLVGVSK